MDEYQNWYCGACKVASKRFGWIVGNTDEYRKKSEKSVSQEFMDALNFTGYDIDRGRRIYWHIQVLLCYCY